MNATTIYGRCRACGWFLFGRNFKIGPLWYRCEACDRITYVEEADE